MHALGTLSALPHVYACMAPDPSTRNCPDLFLPMPSTLQGQHIAARLMALTATLLNLFEPPEREPRARSAFDTLMNHAVPAAITHFL